MKELSATGLILILSLSSGTQTVRERQPKSEAHAPIKLFPVAKVIEVEAASRTRWSLAFAYDDKEGKYKHSGEDAVGDLEKYINEKPGPDWSPGLVAEHVLITKDRTDLEALVRASLKPLLYAQTPVRLASSDGGLTLLLTSLGSENVYNTLRLEAKERAAKEIQKTVLTAIKQFRVITSPGIKNFGVMVVYGTKDFSSPDSAPEAEAVALVAAAATCQKLADAEITEEEFVASSDVYIVDRDDITNQVRKVKISLDKE